MVAANGVAPAVRLPKQRQLSAGMRSFRADDNSDQARPGDQGESPVGSATSAPSRTLPSGSIAAIHAKLQRGVDGALETRRSTSRVNTHHRRRLLSGR